MSQPEFILAESEKMYQQWDHSDNIHRDYSQVVADLVELSQRATKLVDISLETAIGIRKLVQSLREQG